MLQKRYSSVPDHIFGKKYVDFCGIFSPDEATSMTWSAVGGLTKKHA